jgi:hypothetical protein
MNTHTRADNDLDHNRCGTVRAFTIECCDICNVPKVPSNKHWWKCQNKFCEAFDESRASAAYHRCFVPVADILAEEKT